MCHAPYKPCAKSRDLANEMTVTNTTMDQFTPHAVITLLSLVIQPLYALPTKVYLVAIAKVVIVALSKLLLTQLTTSLNTKL